MRGPHDEADESAGNACRKVVKRLMLSGDWWTPSQLQRAIQSVTGCLYSDGTITRRMRELREPEHGGFVLQVRRCQKMVRENGKIRQSREREYQLQERSLFT